MKNSKKDILFLNLGNHFVTIESGFRPKILKSYSDSFNKIFVFCLGKNEKISKHFGNIIVFSGPIWKWPFYFKKINKKNIKFVEIQDYLLGGFLGVIFSKILKIPLVMRSGGPWHYPNNILKNIFSNISKKIIFKNLSNIVFNSNILKNTLLNKKSSLKSSVVYNGVDSNFFTYNEPKNRKILNILYVGRITKDKGIDYLIQAVSILPNLKLRVIGDGNYSNVFENLRNKNIEYLGIKNHLEIKKFMSKSDIFILPTLPESSESFPSVLLEAMSSGLPIIATNVGGISEMFSNEVEGFLIKPYSSQDLSNSIEKLKNFKLRKSMSINGRKNIEKNFDIELQLKKLKNRLFKLN